MSSGAVSEAGSRSPRFGSALCARSIAGSGRSAAEGSRELRPRPQRTRARLRRNGCGIRGRQARPVEGGARSRWQRRRRSMPPTAAPEQPPPTSRGQQHQPRRCRRGRCPPAMPSQKTDLARGSRVSETPLPSLAIASTRASLRIERSLQRSMGNPNRQVAICSTGTKHGCSASAGPSRQRAEVVVQVGHGSRFAARDAVCESARNEAVHHLAARRDATAGSRLPGHRVEVERVKKPSQSRSMGRKSKNACARCRWRSRSCGRAAPGRTDRVGQHLQRSSSFSHAPKARHRRS